MTQPPPAIIDLVEAAYDVEVEGQRWLPRMLEAGLSIMDQGLGVMGVIATRGPDGSPVVEHHQLHVASGPADFPFRHLKAMSEAPPEKVYEYARPGMATTMSELTVEDPWLLDIWSRNVEYAKDALMVSAIDPDGRGIMILAPLAEITQLDPADKQRWLMTGAHLSAGHRIRRAIDRLAGREAGSTTTLPYDAEAVVDPNRLKVTEAQEAARSQDATEALRRAAVQVDRARGQLRRQDPNEALETWRGLVDGRWSMVDWFDSDGRRFLLALRNPPGVGDPRGLTEREHQVATFAGLGESSKLISYRLGISPSRTSVALKSAMHKLGVKTQAQLVDKLRGLRGLEPEADQA